VTAEENERLRSRWLNGSAPWLDAGKRVPAEHLLAAASMTGWTPSAVAERMAALGYRIGKVPACAEVLPGDRKLMRVDQNANARLEWLRLRRPVSRQHVLRAAVGTRTTPTDVVGRLTALGYRVPHPPPDSAVQSGDLTLMTWNLADGSSPFLYPLRIDLPVSQEHVLAAAAALSRAPGSVVERLTALGYRVHDPGVSVELTPSDLDLLRTELDQGRDSWLRRYPEVAVSHLLRAALASGSTPAAVAERLRVLGYRLPEIPSDLAVTDDDKIMLSRNRDGRSPWLVSWVAFDDDDLQLLSGLLGRDQQEIVARLARFGYTGLRSA
jgi:hypothetical protein